MLSHKKVYQYTNTVFEDYVANTVFNTAIPACFWTEKVRYECALGGVYQFEREILLERQKIGIEKAQREGKFKGRVPTAKRKTDEIKTLIAEGLKPHQIAAQLNIGVASVYRYR